MDKGILKALWGGMYILCCVLGFLPEQQGFSYWIMLVVSVAFFVPPFLLLRQAREQEDTKTVKLVRTLSLVSLGVTTLLLVANVLSVLSSTEALGTVLYYILAVVSVPMLSSQSWGISLFLWACLLFASLSKRKKA